ncbi:MAG: phosphomannomutase/phosphoglucomutase [Deltaproteobacteria bacterium]|jgi:phosphomannomutase/phosphoglucomutase
MNPQIFREYDIRGVVDEDLTNQDVTLIGKAFGTYLQGESCSKISVGRDCRLSSEKYQDLIIRGLLATGCDVVDIGVCPTPVFYFSVRHLQKEGGVMVTASHNPPEYNGFKLCSGYDTLFGQQIQRLRELIESETFADGQGHMETADVLTAYKRFVEENIHLAAPLRVAIDAGNGPAGVVAAPIMRNLGCEVFELYCDMDGTFPNHEPDPTVEENMQDLIAVVRENALDVGIGFDGDGDRLGVIDSQGNIIWGDQLMILFAREILARKPGATFIAEVKCSQTLYDDIEKRGGRSVMSKTGHSLIKQKMKEIQAELAGEMSGHMFFADRYFGYDDAIYASCRLLEILAATGKSISELLRDVPKTYNTPEIRVPCPDDVKFQVVKDVTEYFRQRYNVIDIDGVRVLFGDGWGLVRASNTQPVLVLRFESLSEARLSEIRSLMESVVAEIRRRY